MLQTWRSAAQSFGCSMCLRPPGPVSGIGFGTFFAGKPESYRKLTKIKLRPPVREVWERMLVRSR